MADVLTSANAKEIREAFEKLLISSLQRVIDFLKYAEAKNAALLTFTSAWLAVSINVIFSSSMDSTALKHGFGAAIPFFLIAGGAAIASFFPKLNLPGFHGGKHAGPHDKNLLYFGDIGGMTLKEFEPAIHRRYYPGDDHGPRDEYIHDLIVQIRVNSAITSAKMRCFKFGVSMIAIAALAITIPLLWSLIIPLISAPK